MELYALVLEEGKLFSFTLNLSYFLGTHRIGDVQKYSNVSIENVTPVLRPLASEVVVVVVVYSPLPRPIPPSTEGFDGSTYYRLRRVGHLAMAV